MGSRPLGLGLGLRLGLGLAAVSAAVLVACSGASDRAAPPVLSLRAEGAVLRLDGAPADSRYSAAYPNPEKIDAMRVSLRKDGRLVAECTKAGADVPCHETPFFANAARDAAGLRVAVFDTNAMLVEDYVFEGGQADECDGPRMCPDAGGAADAGGDSEYDYTTSGGDTASDGCDASKLKADFCDRINAELASLHVAYVLDCGALGDTYVPHPVPAANGATVPCHDVVEPADTPIYVAAQSCGGDVFLRVAAWANDARAKLLDAGACATSPLVLDLDGDGVTLSALDDGVTFDLLASGEKVRAAWIGRGDALLVLDRNGNGVVDDAAELFGSATARRSYADGFAALSELDTNGDRVIDAHDSAFGALRVWRDANHDGVSDARELSTLARAGVASLALDARHVDGAAAADANGNRIPLVSTFTRVGGGEGELVDAFLRFRALTTK
jgi:hypothetical protein